MPPSPDFLQINSSIWIWQAYDPAVKSDLFSSAVKTGDGLFLIDPIPLAPESLEEMTSSTEVAAVLVTNSNHPRAAADLARKFGGRIFAAKPVAGEMDALLAAAIPESGEIAPGVTAIPIDGAPAGEMAFHFADDGGTIVVGDALIHFEPYGFALLPPKYCVNQKTMRQSLRQLLDWPCQRLLFAHGNPILSGARARLEALLQTSSPDRMKASRARINQEARKPGQE